MVLIGLKIPLNLMKIFLKSYNQESDERYFIDINVQNSAKLCCINNDLLLNSVKNL